MLPRNPAAASPWLGLRRSHISNRRGSLLLNPDTQVELLIAHMLDMRMADRDADAGETHVFQLR